MNDRDKVQQEANAQRVADLIKQKRAEDAAADQADAMNDLVQQFGKKDLPDFVKGLISGYAKEQLTELFNEVRKLWADKDVDAFETDESSPWLMAGDSSLTMKTPANRRSRWYGNWTYTYSQELNVLEAQSGGDLPEVIIVLLSFIMNNPVFRRSPKILISIWGNAAHSHMIKGTGCPYTPMLVRQLLCCCRVLACLKSSP